MKEEEEKTGEKEEEKCDREKVEGREEIGEEEEDKLGG